MTNYNERLDEILTKLENAVALNIGSQGMRGEAPKRSHWKAKQSLLDWHNKQIESKLAHISKCAEDVISIDENGEFSMKAIPLSLVAAERNKLREVK